MSLRGAGTGLSGAHQSSSWRCRDSRSLQLTRSTVLSSACWKAFKSPQRECSFHKSYLSSSKWVGFTPGSLRGNLHKLTAAPGGTLLGFLRPICWALKPGASRTSIFTLLSRCFYLSRIQQQLIDFSPLYLCQQSITVLPQGDANSLLPAPLKALPFQGDLSRYRWKVRGKWPQEVSGLGQHQAIELQEFKKLQHAELLCCSKAMGHVSKYSSMLLATMLNGSIVSTRALTNHSPLHVTHTMHGQALNLQAGECYSRFSWSMSNVISRQQCVFPAPARSDIALNS